MASSTTVVRLDTDFKRRERARRDALAAWAEYQATGLHVTADEAGAWLARLAAGEDADPPECHC